MPLVSCSTLSKRRQQAERLHDQFPSAFRGEADKDFLKSLDVYHSIYDPQLHLGRTIALLQSSGTGKSRLVKEIGNKVRFIF
jgi:hypothetical protein